MPEPRPPTQPNIPDRGMEELKIKVLVADDTSIILQTTARILSMFGCTVETVENGQELLKRLTEAEPGEFGLVITDKEMPVMGGIEVIRKIRTDARFSQLPVILYSGALTTEDEEFVQNLGGRCLRKPFGIGELKTKVQEAIKGSSV